MAKVHILVVENDSSIRELMRECLEGPDYRVSMADGGAAARPILQRLNVDMVITDEVMPGETGRQLAEYAQSLGIPTLLMTGNIAIKDELARGPHRYLSKPFPLAALRKEVEVVLSSRSKVHLTA